MKNQSSFNRSTDLIKNVIKHYVLWFNCENQVFWRSLKSMIRVSIKFISPHFASNCSNSLVKGSIQTLFGYFKLENWSQTYLWYYVQLSIIITFCYLGNKIDKKETETVSQKFNSSDRFETYNQTEPIYFSAFSQYTFLSWKWKKILRRYFSLVFKDRGAEKPLGYDSFENT